MQKSQNADDTAAKVEQGAAKGSQKIAKDRKRVRLSSFDWRIIRHAVMVDGTSARDGGRP